MVLNRSEEESYHYLVKVLGKLIEVARSVFRDFAPSPAWVGGAVIRSTL
jgi:hypothetical protein